ncbi:MAG TPA: ubiquinol-cytochrome C chaperone family protein [Sphingomicrobium sp.]|nr:ubiquinol-cytochrome C chaperone family protein [Sphingomicrobium sp.]
MLRFLFGRLTDQPRRGQALFDRAVAEARKEHWFVAGEVPDTIDGRFAMLATICALFIVRLESGSPQGDAASAALTERFIEAMDAEHRELGLNDPGLGRRVRKLVGSLERRVDEWRTAVAGESGWSETIVSSIYHGEEPRDGALMHSAKALRDLWEDLSQVPEDQLARGCVDA